MIRDISGHPSLNAECLGPLWELSEGGIGYDSGSREGPGTEQASCTVLVNEYMVDRNWCLPSAHVLGPEWAVWHPFSS